ncbi:MAG: polyphosphate kinase 2 family protein [Pyrinomonadaceae bacterium]
MNIEQFRVVEDSALDLAEYPTDFIGEYKNKHDAKAALKQNKKRLDALEQVLYADDKYSVLLLFQAMDAAGKDGTIRHVMSGINPQGCQVYSFKQPSKEELDHDFLWRCSKALPERGRIGIFNRSYYEDVLVVRVHPEILESSPLPDEIKNDPQIWQKRFEQIRNFEKQLCENGTKIVKFFLHVSKTEQKQRFLARINTPEKNWKFASTDVKERGFWDDYQKAYRDALQATSTPDAPWYVIPADKKWFMRLAVAEIVAQTMESLDLKYPKPTQNHLDELAEAAQILEAES